MQDNKSIVDRLSTIVLAVAAAIVVVLLIQRARSSPATLFEENDTRRLSAPVYIDSWEETLGKGITIGEPTASVQIIEFIDFECPACRRFYETGAALRRRYADKDLAFTFVHYPLPYHPYAASGARAAECADEVGMFEQFHDQVFESHEFVGARPWSWFAKNAGVQNPEAFQECVDSDRPFPRIKAGQLEGARFAVTGTPTVVINGFSYGAVVPKLPELDKRIGAILDGRQPFLHNEDPTEGSVNARGIGQSGAPGDGLWSDAQDVSCPSCVLQFDTVVTLGSVNGSGSLPGEPRSIARDQRGRFYVAFPDLGHVLVFDSTGQPLQSIGRSGEGPGEYQLAYLVRVGEADTALVVDMTHQLSFVAPSGRFVRRTRPLVQTADLLVTDNRKVVFSGRRIALSDSDQTGTMFHVLDPRALTIERSFHQMEGEGGRVPRFHLGRAREADRFWAIHRFVGEYRVLQYTTEGFVRRQFSRRPSWMRPVQSEDDVIPAPRPTVRGIREFEEELWIIGRYPVEEWTRYWNREVFGDDLEASARELEETKVFRSVVEVIDAETGQLVTAADVPGLVVALLPDQHVASYRENDAGIPFIDIFRMSVSRH